MLARYKIGTAVVVTHQGVEKTVVIRGGPDEPSHICAYRVQEYRGRKFTANFFNVPTSAVLRTA